VREGTVSEIRTTYKTTPTMDSQSPSAEKQIGMRHVLRYDVQAGGGMTLCSEGDGSDR
jgi:hypothetical protein